MAGITLASTVSVLAFDLLCGLLPGAGFTDATSSVDCVRVGGGNAAVVAAGAGTGTGAGTLTSASTGSLGAGMVGKGGATLPVLATSGLAPGGAFLAISCGAVP